MSQITLSMSAPMARLIARGIRLEARLIGPQMHPDVKALLNDADWLDEQAEKVEREERLASLPEKKYGHIAEEWRSGI